MTKELSPDIVSISHDPHETKLIVEDDGNGVPSEDYEFVFKPFARLRQEESKSHYLGIFAMTIHRVPTAAPSIPPLIQRADQSMGVYL